MRRLISFALCFALVGAIGCEMKSGTAPSTDPNKPDATRKLTLTVAKDHTITQGATDNVMVNVNRDNFKDVVTLEVTNLPKGVTLESRDMTIPADQNSITLTLKADADAPTVTDHQFQIVGKSKDIKSEPANIKLTVKAK
jgi:hypothetical protein